MKDRIGFSSSRTLGSWLIRKLTKSSASHTFLIYFDKDFQQDMVLEATTLWGVRIIALVEFQRTHNIVETIPLTHSVDLGIRRAGRELGSPYDYTGAIGMLWVLLGRWLGAKWRNPLQSAHALFCSELMAKILRWSAYPRFPLQPSNATPQKLLAFFHEERDHPGQQTTETTQP